MTKLDRVHAFVLERIRRGEYPVGSRLPSLRELAGELGVHPNTVALAYRDLAERGLVWSEQGKGTFVRSVPRANGEETDDGRLRRELAALAQRAFDAGVGPEAFVRLAREVATGESAADRARACFVECNPFDTEEVARHIAHLLHLRVEPLLLDRLEADPDVELRDVDVVITTPYHVDEVGRAVGTTATVLCVSVTPTAQTLVSLARMPEGARVAVVSSNDRTLERLVEMVRIHARRDPVAACLADDAQLAAAVAAADVVVDTLAVHGDVLRVGPGRPVLTVHFQLEANSLEYLRARVEDLLPGLHGAGAA